ncbi:(d)CMP kinase [Sediminispirochaeta smaragdinae]|jgi:cytidylate kinase|uniref:Cytidylate kinase n=1 Tax=Sediminispirochaeta smaragdinae (strain DSM 11293 / JCM 15392 / SEBR 4228) TaxID=573413 RepID=E1R768_SEDSS|nr:AAA family ATPase [Sediminispirochaeta smaragdinae]ADK81395.1 cytidylate kinase [Sediminispirochaeta smaragdinae DSM 11293]
MSNNSDSFLSFPKGFGIAVSGKSGCGNSTVSALCAEKLGIQLVNFTFRQLAEERGVTFAELCKMAETNFDIDRELDRRQVEMAKERPSVLGSRLAIWMFNSAHLKVYLYASLLVRAERILRREGGSLEKNIKETHQRDQRDHDRYLKIYDIDNDDYEFADMVINVENLFPEEIAKMIVERALQTLI